MYSHVEMLDFKVRLKDFGHGELYCIVEICRIGIQRPQATHLSCLSLCIRSIRIGIIIFHTSFLPGSKEVQSVKVLGKL